MLFSLFFFYCYGDHRDLHSFPTRRSSDLRKTGGRIGCQSTPRSGMENRDEPRFWPTVKKDRKSTRLNSSHVAISYAVFCLKKKKKKKNKNKSNKNSNKIEVPTYSS